METKEKRKALEKQAAIKGLDQELDFVKKYTENKLGRLSSLAKPEIVHYASKANNGNDMLCLPGTITVFIGTRKSKKIEELRKIIRANNAKAEAKLMAEVRASFLERKLVSKAEAQEQLLGSDSFFKITCGSKVILDGGFLTKDSDLTYLSIPYCGTPFPKRPPFPTPFPDFEFKEYLKGGKASKLEALILYHEPNLSKLEMEVLSKIPTDSREILVGTGTQAIGTCIWYASAVAVAALAFMTATASCADIVQLRDIRLKDELLDSFNAEQAAEALLDLRERALLNG